MRAADGAPLVSIIVLCHNYGRFLAGAIESALAQTYENCEVLVVDDGSTDDSLEVASRYADSVRISTHPNIGMEPTCNQAVAEAKGEYFAFLSADDLFEPTYVDELLRALRRSPDASYAYCRMRMFGAQSGVMRCFPYSPYLLARRLNYINGCALTAREDYLSLGGYAEELADYGLEDWDFWLTMLEHGKRGTYLRAPLLRWRRHTAGSRNVEEGERLRQAVEVIRGRHRRLYESMGDASGRIAYAAEFCVAVADMALGLSRWPRVVHALERRAWRRFERRHARLIDGDRRQ